MSACVLAAAALCAALCAVLFAFIHLCKQDRAPTHADITHNKASFATHARTHTHTHTPPMQVEQVCGAFGTWKMEQVRPGHHIFRGGVLQSYTVAVDHHEKTKQPNNFVF